MRKNLELAEKYRIRTGEYATETGERFGAFGIKRPDCELHVIMCEANELAEWDHVSVSGRKGGRGHTPTRDQMCHVKKLFFEDEECVMQLHPPESGYVNIHPNCLHLWRPASAVIPLPPKICV